MLISAALLAGCGRQEDSTSSDGSGGQNNTGDTDNPEGDTADLPSQTTTSPEDDAFYLMSSRNMIFDIIAANMEEPADRTLCYIGMQYYQGEAALLYVKPCDKYTIMRTEDDEKYEVVVPNPDCGLYAYTEDGVRNLLIPGEPLRESLGIEKDSGEFQYYYDYAWYISDEGDCYCIPRKADGESYFLKIDQSGQLCYKAVVEPTMAF